ncbi:MAG: SDR family oxidoreductase [Deltaproteobacteria bacterium]|nr:SDR family oxidoreductase [Deltaproteobacteria bacterium]
MARIAWTLKDMPSQRGKRAYVTGANSGFGYQTALELARRGATVVLACRDASRGQEAMRAIRAEVHDALLELAILDLGSLASVRAAAQEELAKHAPLDLLVNNAGLMTPPTRQRTSDGFEVQLGTNVLAHFALTGLLLPAIERAPAPRVVTLASIAHRQGRIDFDDVQSEKAYVPMRAYAQSKLANLMLALELERRLRRGGKRSVSVACHPGVAPTNLLTNVGPKWIAFVRRWVITALSNSVPGGALPTLFAATASEARGGGYYGPQGLGEVRGNDVGEATIAPQATDEAIAARLWATCEELTAVRFLDV